MSYSFFCFYLNDTMTLSGPRRKCNNISWILANTLHYLAGGKGIQMYHDTTIQILIVWVEKLDKQYYISNIFLFL